MSGRFKLLLFFVIVGIGAAAAVGIFTTSRKAAQPYERVMLVTIDTLRADHLKSYGYFRETSPFLSSLAEKGVLFERMVASTSHTAPSHATIFTGLYPFEHGLLVNGSTLRPEAFHIRKFFNGLGFQVEAFTATRFMEGRVGFDKVPEHIEPIPAAIIRADRNTERFLRWLDKGRSNDRFFSWLHYYDVHQWNLVQHIPQEELEVMKNSSSDKLLSFKYETHGVPRDFFKKEEKLVEAINNYDAELLFVDKQLERVFKEFEKRGWAEDTLWIITSDHGEGLGNHRYKGHGEFLYQEQLHVPCLFIAKNLSSGRIPTRVRSIDLFPTIMELMGKSSLPEASSLPGISLVPFLTGHEIPDALAHDLPAFAQRRPKDAVTFRRKWREGDVFAYLDGPQKIIQYSDGPDERYHLENDPLEKENLYGKDPGMDQALESKLEKILERNTSQDLPQSEMDKETLDDLKTLGYL